MITVSGILANHLNVVSGSIAGRCRICGIETQAGYRSKEALSGNFNDWQYLKYGTDVVCEYCRACLSDTGVHGKALRNYSLVANKDILVLLNDKTLIPKYILMNFATPYVFLVSYSKKKHIFLRCKINYDDMPIYISTDLYDLIVYREEFQRLYKLCSALYDAGFSKNEILHGSYSKWAKMDSFDKFFEYEAIIKQYRNTHLLHFSLYCVGGKKDDTN